MNSKRYLVLVCIVACGSVGDVCLSRGMKNIGHVSLANLGQLVSAVWNPWVALGILFLLGFFAAYATALSWADLTFVLPATSFGYVVIALLSQFVLHEHVSLIRWIGILLVSAGVGVVARGPSLTRHHEKKELVPFGAAAEGSNG